MPILFVILTLILTSCAPPKAQKRSSLTGLGTTGGFDKDLNAYVHNGDERVEKELERQSQMNTDAKSTVQPSELSARLKEFELARFQKGQVESSRFGKARMTLKVFFHDREPIEFSGPLQVEGMKVRFSDSKDGFSLKGEIEDEERRSLGRFEIKDEKRGDEAILFYKAYRGKLTVREDREHPVTQGSNLDRQIKDLREDTFAWVHNWSVVRGVSVYLVDVVKVVDKTKPKFSQPLAIFRIKGESKQTGDRVYEAKNLKSDSKAQVRLIGNGEMNSRRMFEITVPEGNQNKSVMLDIEAELEQDAEGEFLAEPKIFGEKKAAIHSEKAYLGIDLSLPRTARMTKDFDRNLESRGVRAYIAKFQTEARRDLNAFFQNAYPFREMMETVARTYDVSPAFAYLTVVESAYFTGGKYEIQKAKTTSALGPFQLVNGTAQEMGLKISAGPDDERRFFAPSSCAAAKYVRKMVNAFDDSDTTLAILGYYQGPGGAAAAIYCSYDGSAGDRRACAKRINRSGGFDGKDYGRFIQLAKKYNYTYLDMEKTAAIPQHMRDYVNKKLAVYFIANNMERYGFSIGKNARTALPSNGTVFPERPMNDASCQQAIGIFQASS